MITYNYEHKDKHKHKRRSEYGCKDKRTSRQLLGVAAALTLGFIATSAMAEDWKIGMIAPTTGPLATVGTRQLTTINWWGQQVNKNGGLQGKNVQVIHCNDEATPEKAVNCARTLLSQGIVMLINSSVTGPIRATMPLVKNGPVMLTGSPNVLPDPSSFVFQTSPSDEDLVLALGEFAKANGVKRLGVIAATDASGEVGATSAAAVFPKLGVQYDLARIDLRATDATTQLARVAGPQTQLIYSTYTGGGAVTVVKGYNNLGLSQPFVLSFGNISDSFMALMKNDMPTRLLGTALKGVVPDMLARDEKDRIASFTKDYEQSHPGDRVDMLNLIALALADVVESALRNVKDPANAESVKAYLESAPIKSFQPMRFSASSHVGMRSDDVAIVEYKRDRWVKADPIK